MLHITSDINLLELTPDKIKWLSVLEHAILRNEPICGLSEDFAPCTVLRIAGLNIALTFEKQDDGAYVISDFFRDDLIYRPENLDEDNPFILSHLSTLKSRDYEKIDNINYSIFIPTYEKIVKVYPEATDYILFDALFMIEAYDNSGKIELLNLADEIFCWLEKKEKEPDSDIYLINRLQIAKRIRDLTDEEIAKLISTAESSDLNVIKAGANILLGNKKTAEYYINMLEDKDKEEFLKYPIYNLMNK